MQLGILSFKFPHNNPALRNGCYSSWWQSLLKFLCCGFVIHEVFGRQKELFVSPAWCLRCASCWSYLKFYFKYVEPVRSVFFFFISRESIYPPVERSYFRKCNCDAILSFDQELWIPFRHVHKRPPHSTPVDVDPQVTTRWQTDSALILL